MDSIKLNKEDWEWLKKLHEGFEELFLEEENLLYSLLQIGIDPTFRQDVIELYKRVEPLSKFFLREDPPFGITPLEAGARQSEISARSQDWMSREDKPIIAGKGWDKVVLGAYRAEVENSLGEIGDIKRYGDVYFADYPNMGIQISYKNQDDKVKSIFFYNQDPSKINFSTFIGQTDKGINWDASYEDIVYIYGKPKKDHKDDSWRRVVYDGIDFRFEHGKLVRIGITEN